MPAVMRSLRESETLETVVIAMTTSVMACGKCPTNWAPCPSSTGRFPGSRRQVLGTSETVSPSQGAGPRPAAAVAFAGSTGMTNSDRSTVAGSAVIEMPRMGPPVTFPFTPRKRLAPREPIDPSMIMLSRRSCQFGAATPHAALALLFFGVRSHLPFRIPCRECKLFA